MYYSYPFKGFDLMKSRMWRRLWKSLAHFTNSLDQLSCTKSPTRQIPYKRNKDIRTTDRKRQRQSDKWWSSPGVESAVKWCVLTETDLGHFLIQIDGRLFFSLSLSLCFSRNKVRIPCSEMRMFHLGLLNLNQFLMYCDLL